MSYLENWRVILDLLNSESLKLTTRHFDSVFLSDFSLQDWNNFWITLSLCFKLRETSHVVFVIRVTPFTFSTTERLHFYKVTEGELITATQRKNTVLRRTYSVEVDLGDKLPTLIFRDFTLTTLIKGLRVHDYMVVQKVRVTPRPTWNSLEVVINSSHWVVLGSFLEDPLSLIWCLLSYLFIHCISRFSFSEVVNVHYISLLSWM